MSGIPEDVSGHAKLIERARIKSAMLRMGEPIAFGSDADLLDELLASMAALVAQRDELVEALKPFTADATMPRLLCGDAAGIVTVNDFRRALLALHHVEEDNGHPDH